jgi:ABC-2 type transport system ATP-binding protein
VAALVGPNGAGKTTLLQLAAGLLDPSAGAVKVFGHSPQREPKAALPRVGFVAQDHPLYHGFSVADMLTLGRKLNPHWEDQIARTRLEQLQIPLDRPTGKLSGGQQAQVALAMALAKRAELILLDEPLASLDPLARHDFLRTLMGATAAHGLTVLLSSHIVSDLERVCDYLIVLSSAHVQLAGGIEEIVRTHKRLVGPRTDPAAVASIHNVIEENSTDRQTTLLVHVNGHLFDPSWEMCDVSLEEIVLAYLGQPTAVAYPVVRREEHLGVTR